MNRSKKNVFDNNKDAIYSIIRDAFWLEYRVSFNINASSKGILFDKLFYFDLRSPSVINEGYLLKNPTNLLALIMHKRKSDGALKSFKKAFNFTQREDDGIPLQSIER